MNISTPSRVHVTEAIIVGIIFLMIGTTISIFAKAIPILNGSDCVKPSIPLALFLFGTGFVTYFYCKILGINFL